MYSTLFSLAMKYGSKILIGLAAFLLLLGLYFHWKNSIFNEGYNKATAEWQKREAVIERQSAELIKLKLIENTAKERESQERLIGALKYYVKTNEERERKLTADFNKRVFVRSKCPAGSGNAVSATPEIPVGNTQTRGAINEPELGREDTRALFSTIADVDQMASVCKQALDFIKQNGMIE